MELVIVALIATVIPACTLILGWYTLRRKVNNDYVASLDKRLEDYADDVKRFKDQDKHREHELDACFRDRDRYHRECLILQTENIELRRRVDLLEGR